MVHQNKKNMEIIMKKNILDFPEQFKKGIDSAKNLRIKGRFDNVVVCGMGGSAWPVELLNNWLNFTFPLYVSKTYDLPPQTNKKSLVIIISYSGNTEEPLNCYLEAKRKKLKIVGVATGGKLKEICQKDKTPLILMPDDVSAPRMGCGYTFAALAKLLSNAGLIKDKSREIIATAKKVNAERSEKDGKTLADKIADKTPVIYTSDRLKTVAYVWKIKFNENSKIPAFSNYFPELNHNELSAYAKINNNFFVIILRNAKENPRILKRISLTADIIKSKGIPLELIDYKGDTILEKIFNSLLLADWTSYSLALNYKIDPLSVKLQEGFKKKLANK